MKRRKVKLPSFRPLRRPPPIKNDRHAKAYEEALVCADLDRHPGMWVSGRELRIQCPQRYSLNLKRTLKRMEKDGILLQKRTRVFDTMAYATMNQMVGEYKRLEGRNDMRQEKKAQELGVSDYFYIKIRSEFERRENSANRRPA